MTTTTKQYWREHVAAVKSQAITAKAYAQQHGLVLSTLYYWQRRLKTTAVTQAKSESVATLRPSNFVSLHVKTSDNYAVRPMTTSCTLVLGTGVRLEMSALPNPQWLAALAHCANGGH
jgi:transposase-like protein